LDSCRVRLRYFEEKMTMKKKERRNNQEKDRKAKR